MISVVTWINKFSLLHWSSCRLGKLWHYKTLELCGAAISRAEVNVGDGTGPWCLWHSAACQPFCQTVGPSAQPGLPFCGSCCTPAAGKVCSERGSQDQPAVGRGVLDVSGQSSVLCCYTKGCFYWYNFTPLKATVVPYLTTICVRPIWQDKVGVV